MFKARKYLVVMFVFLLCCLSLGGGVRANDPVMDFVMNIVRNRERFDFSQEEADKLTDDLDNQLRKKFGRELTLQERRTAYADAVDKFFNSGKKLNITAVCYLVGCIVNLVNMVLKRLRLFFTTTVQGASVLLPSYLLHCLEKENGVFVMLH